MLIVSGKENYSITEMVIFKKAANKPRPYGKIVSDQMKKKQDFKKEQN